MPDVVSNLTLTPSPVRTRSGLIDAIARHARLRPEAVAAADIDDSGVVGREWTYSRLAAVATRRSHLLADLTQVGDVVLAVLPSGADSVAWLSAGIAAGVKFLPMHTQIAGPEALAVARRAGARLAIVVPEVGADAALRELISPGLLDSDPEANTSGVLRSLDLIRAEAGAIVLGSSGTTGLPKLALRESSALDADAENVIEGMSLTSEDCVLACTPLSHSYGVDLLLATLTAGASLHVLGQFNAEVVAKRMHESATVLPGVPFIFEALARIPPSGRPRTRLALSAGSPLPERVRREFQGAWGIEIGQLFGATELGTVSMAIPGTADFMADSVGRPLPGVSMRIVDPDDPNRRLTVGEEGQLAVAAPSMLSEYLDGEVPRVDGHLLTGDLARIDDRGRVFITGRLKLLVDVGAYKVNPLEVESELLKHPGVAECVVLPLVLSDTIQRLRAVYVPSGSTFISPEALRGFLRERLSPSKVPRVIEAVASLPKTATGKVLRDKV